MMMTTTTTATTTTLLLKLLFSLSFLLSTTENVSDPYELVVELGPVEPARGTEPDDTAVEANPLAVSSRVSGYLDRRDDVDVYRFAGPAGRYRLAVTAPTGLPVRWSWQGEARETAGVLELGAGALLRLERADRALPRGEVLPAADLPYAIELGPVN